MKKFVITLSIIVLIILSQIVMFNRVYYSKEDKQLAQIIENAVSLISKDLVRDYNGEFTVSNVEYVCFAGSVYSASAHEITKKVFPEYKYSNYLEARKHIRKGDGSSILMLIKEKSLIPIFIALYFFDIEFSDNLKALENLDACYKPTNKNITISMVKKQKEYNSAWQGDPLYRTHITIK